MKQVNYTITPAEYQAQSRLTYVQVMQNIIREWASILSPAETTVLAFVADRTVAFHKTQEKIPYSHFLNGVTSKDGSIITRGINISRRTLHNVLMSLKRHGLISTSNGNNESYLFELNVKTILEGVKTVARIIKNEHKLRIGGMQNLHQGGAKFAPITKGSKTKEELTNVSSGASPVALGGIPKKLYDIYEEVKARTAARREQKLQKLNGKLTKLAFYHSWQKSLKSHFPSANIVSLADEEWFKLRGKLAVYKLSVPLAEFVEWSVSEWGVIRMVIQKWIDKNPTLPEFTVVPSVKSFSSYLKHIVLMHSDRTQLAQGDQAVDRVRKLEAELTTARQHIASLEQKRSRGTALDTSRRAGLNYSQSSDD